VRDASDTSIGGKAQDRVGMKWLCLPTANDRIRDLAGRNLTIPADQRYDLQDMARIQQVLVES
jgi:hypothetical protein